MKLKLVKQCSILSADDSNLFQTWYESGLTTIPAFVQPSVTEAGVIVAPS